VVVRLYYDGSSAEHRKMKLSEEDMSGPSSCVDWLTQLDDPSSSIVPQNGIEKGRLWTFCAYTDNTRQP
jgi:hypothetical protein